MHSHSKNEGPATKSQPSTDRSRVVWVTIRWAGFPNFDKFRAEAQLSQHPRPPKTNQQLAHANQQGVGPESLWDQNIYSPLGETLDKIKHKSYFPTLCASFRPLSVRGFPPGWYWLADCDCVGGNLNRMNISWQWAFGIFGRGTINLQRGILERESRALGYLCAIARRYIFYYLTIYLVG